MWSNPLQLPKKISKENLIFCEKETFLKQIFWIFADFIGRMD